MTCRENFKIFLFLMIFFHRLLVHKVTQEIMWACITPRSTIKELPDLLRQAVYILARYYTAYGYIIKLAAVQPLLSVCNSGAFCHQVATCKNKQNEDKNVLRYIFSCFHHSTSAMQ